MKYAELQVTSNFSFLRGASHAEELVGRAAGLGYSALAVTDECSLAGIVRAHVAARKAPDGKPAWTTTTASESATRTRLRAKKPARCL